MSDFRTVPGFQDVWRPLAGRRVRPEETSIGSAARDRLSRLTRGAPQVVTTVKGAFRTGAGLKQHLDYISRGGALELEERDGGRVRGRDAVRELAEDWAWAAQTDTRNHLGNKPIGVSIVLSMPHGVEANKVLEASRDFVAATFADRFDYAMVLHQETHPHVHLCVRSLGDEGARLRRAKADLEAWRQGFAAALRGRGVEADATPRRARGVIHKPERSRAFWTRVDYELGKREMGEGLKIFFADAEKEAREPPSGPHPWEAAIHQRQALVRGLYLSQAELLKRSASADERALGEGLEAFVRNMPPVETQRAQIARLIRQEREKLARERDRGREREPERER